MATKKNHTNSTNKKSSSAEKKVNKAANEAEKKIDKASDKIEAKAHDIADDAKKAADKAGDKAKEAWNEGKKSVEDLVDKVIDEDKMDSYLENIKNKFKTASAKDRVIFVVGAAALIRSLVILSEFVWGIIILLIAIVLMNMFFNRK